AAEKVNTEKVIKMLLIHDIGEIDAGDVFFFDEVERTKVVEKEVRAVKRIFGILPNEIEGELLEIWNEFENGETKEAKFARAIDRVMPILQNLYNNKQSWTENNITKEQILTKTSYINEASKILWQSISEKINVAFEKDNL
ncbi:MAG TPA: HD domain-containing protein, partial [Pyrinomonadaceae bacterium]|nr:HD domain-containing protein [Pyrinomonadaceae bacterium]